MFTIYLTVLIYVDEGLFVSENFDKLCSQLPTQAHNICSNVKVNGFNGIITSDMWCLSIFENGVHF